MAVLEWLVAGVLVGAGALTAFLAAFGWRFGDVPGSDWFVGLMVANTVWVASDLLRLFVDGRAVLFALEQVALGGATVVPVLWFSFVVAYTGREHRLDRRRLALLWAVPALVLLAVATAPVHDLYFRRVAFEAGRSGLVLQTLPGPVSWLNFAYFAVLLALGLWLVVRLVWEHERLFSGQAVWLLVGTLAPVALLVVALVWPLPEDLPAISLGFSVLGLAYARGLFGHRLLDMSPASRRIGIPEAFDDLEEAVVVVDTDGNVVALNDRACRLLDCRRDRALGATLDRVAPALADLAGPGPAVATPDARDGDTDDTDVTVHGRVLSVSGSRVTDSRGRATGWALVARDVTTDRRRQQRLDVLSRVFRHNIRNRMNAVVGPVGVLASRLDGEDAETAATALEASRDVLRLSEKARDVEGMMTGDVSPTEVRVESFLRGVGRSVRDRTEFTLDLSVPPDLTVGTDPGILSVVVENVVENAVEHSSTNHRSSSTRDDAVEHGSTSPGSHARQDAVEHSSASPRSHAHEDAVEHSSTSHRSSSTRDDAGSASSSEDAVEHSSTCAPSSSAQEDAAKRGSTSPPSPNSRTGDRRDSVPPHVRITAEDHDGGCLLHVYDSGPGVPSVELDALRTGSETELEHASGLGLWAVHWGVTRLDGAVGFATLPDGARVSLWVPDLEREAGPAPLPDDYRTGGDGGDEGTVEWFGRESAASEPGGSTVGSGAVDADRPTDP